MSSKLELRIQIEHPFTNIGTLQTLIRSCQLEGIVELTQGTGAAVLRWRKREDDPRSVHLAIPLRWLTDADHVERLETCVNNFMTSIRLNSRSR